MNDSRIPMKGTLMATTESARPKVEDEVFYDGLTTYWVPIFEGSLDRSANEAVKIAAGLDGPFEDYINVQRVSGRVDWTAEGWHFFKGDDGEFECWEVDAQ